jgi:hypothetical protein
LGLLNAGLVISLGKIAFSGTPAVLIIFIALFFFKKLPLYKMKHLIGLLLSFVFSSVSFFLLLLEPFFIWQSKGKSDS